MEDGTLTEEHAGQFFEGVMAAAGKHTVVEPEVDDQTSSEEREMAAIADVVRYGAEDQHCHRCPEYG